MVRLSPKRVRYDAHIPAVQSGGGLVQEQDFPPRDKAAGNGKPLLLPARQYGRVGVFIRIQSKAP